MLKCFSPPVSPAASSIHAQLQQSRWHIHAHALKHPSSSMRRWDPSLSHTINERERRLNPVYEYGGTETVGTGLSVFILEYQIFILA